MKCCGGRALFVALGSLLLGPGCRPDTPPVSVQGAVPLKIWIVLAPADNGIAAPISGAPTVCESNNTTPCTQANVGTVCPPGDSCIVQHSGRNNIGCRLSQDEVIAIVGELYTNHQILGGLNLEPPFADLATIISVVEDHYLGNRMHPWLVFQMFVGEGNWSLHHLNIYFVGNVLHPDNDDPVAMCLDPREAGFDKPLIMINDGGFEQQAQGFLPGPVRNYPAGYTPSAVATYNVLTHEVGHYFLDRDGCLPYGQNEHVPANFIHIMADIPAPPPSPLLSRSGEMEEIQCRHSSGTWTWALDNCTRCP